MRGDPTGECKSPADREIIGGAIVDGLFYGLVIQLLCCVGKKRQNYVLDIGCMTALMIAIRSATHTIVVIV